MINLKEILKKISEPMPIWRKLVDRCLFWRKFVDRVIWRKKNVQFFEVQPYDSFHKKWGKHEEQLNFIQNCPAQH